MKIFEKKKYSLPETKKRKESTENILHFGFAWKIISPLKVDLLFAREVSYYIITIYLPTFMIVMVSWFSFWIDHKSVSLFYFVLSKSHWTCRFLGSCKSQPLRYNLPGDVHYDGLHPRLPPPRGLHQGSGRVDGNVRFLCLLLPHGIRFCELCSQAVT